MMNFFIDTTALWHLSIFLVFCFIVWYFLRKREKPHLFISKIFYEEKTFRERLAILSPYLLVATFFSFLSAYINPHYFILKEDSNKRVPSEGIAIYLVLDISLSMLEPIIRLNPNETWVKTTKIDYLKNVTSQFILGNEELSGRNNDLIGIVTFARKAQILAPLTLDHPRILSLLNALQVNPSDEEKGTVLGYAIFKTANLINATRYFTEKVDKNPYSIKNPIIVLITDGFQEVNPKDYDNPLRSIDFVDAIQFAKNHGIRVYIINIDPKIALKQYADYRKLFTLTTGLTGGNFFFVDENKDLNQIFKEINSLEKSSFSSYFKQNFNDPFLYERIDLYPYFLIIGLAFFAIYIFLEAIFIRRIP